MSLEAKIEALTAALNNVAAAIAAGPDLNQPRAGYAPAAADAGKQVVIPATPPTVVQPVQPTPAQVPVQPPVVASGNVPVVSANVAMPPPPSFAPPQPAPAPAAPQQTGAPFNDIKGLIGYAMETYKAIGPQKGAGIQTILQNLGYSNINAVSPEHFGQFYTAVEGLKA